MRHQFVQNLILLVILIGFAPPLWGWSTPNVPVDDPVYRDVDKLVAAGLVTDVIYGQRPWSRWEFARITAAAMKNRERIGPPIAPDDREISFRLKIDEIINKLKAEFREELVDRGDIEGETKGIRIHPLEQVQFDYTLLDSPFRDVPAANGIGNIDARINPLVANREGRHYVDGNTLGLETTHRVKLSRFFSIYARPRFELLAPNTGSADLNPIVQRLYGKFAYRNFELEIGRDSLVWGQGEFGGLILSNNARPFDMIKVGTVSPFILPWIFRYLGPNEFQVFFAEMGPEREFPHAILTGYKWTIKPVHFFELGLNHVVMMGGDGANGPTFWEAIGEFTGILSAVTENKRGGAASTNRLLSLEGRATFPFLRNAILYAEIGFDDTNSEIDVLFEDNAMYYAGIYVPRLTNDGFVDLRLEYKHIPSVSYRHGTYSSGYTLNRRLLADELGPDSDGVSVKLRTDLGENLLLTSEAAYERRDSDLFTTTAVGVDVLDIYKTQDNPAEHRLRLNNQLSWNLRRDLRMDLGLGYEHVHSFNFVQNADVDNFLGSLALTWRPNL